jgi:glutamate--cysteine ligase
MPLQGLSASWQGGTLRDLARDVVAIAADGLRARGRRNERGEDESIFLAPLQEIAAGGPTQSEYWLARYHGVWQRDIRRIFAESSI